jgi:hypothetical protein
MVVYHCLNYFYNDREILKYLHFLPPSFICIAGFLVTSVYLAKYDIGDSRLHRRLFIRGFKLLLIFIALNLFVNSLVSTSYNRNPLGQDVFLNHLDSIFLIGGSRRAIFEVLLPISYLLLLSGVLLKGCRIFPYFLHVVSGATILVCLILAFQEVLPYNLELLSMGFLGMVGGFIAMRQIDRFASHLGFLLIAYVLYLAVISYWYPVYALNIIGICLTLALLYSLGLKAGTQGIIQEGIILLGKYSLLAYIVQIGVLQILFRGMRKLPLGESRLIISLVATLIIMLAIIEAVDHVRARWSFVNRMYNAVFA